MNLTVQNVERVWVNLPYRPVPARNMIRELPHWTVFELCKVTLACGAQGVGETMVYYTWGATTEEAVKRSIGKPATEIMWDDSLGAGLQMALFDVVGRALDIPLYQLLGSKIRDEAFISWWSIDMLPEDWLAECKAALAAGYISYKFKARPWFDMEEQLRLVTAELPEHFEIDLDFNAMLNESAHATRVLRSLEKYRHVKIFESPIPQADVAGAIHLRRQTCVPIAMHAGIPPLPTALAQDVCDGFVVTGGVSQVLRESAIIAQFNKVFWLQLVGTGLTTMFGVHLAAVSSHARWPAVSCVNLYESTLLACPLVVANGAIKVPEAPGLGVEVDWESVERYRIDPIPKPYPHPNLLIEVSWPSGAVDDYAHGLQYWDDFMNGRRPVFSPGVSMNIIPDDGSAEWRARRAAALKKPSWVMRPT